MSLRAGALVVEFYVMENEQASEEKTLLEWAVRLCPDSPRKRIKEWIVAGRFCLDGAVVTKAGLRMADPGERLIMGAPDKAPKDWGHRKRIHPKLVLVHLDSSMAIVDKESGLLSVPADGQDKISAIEVLANYLNDPRGEATRRSFFGKKDAVKPLPVHRLDQYTSGLLCIALNDDARRNLIQQLRSHDFLREYIAYADGDAPTPEGTWRNHMLLDESGYNQTVVEAGTPNAVEAVTHYKVEKVFERHHVSKLRIRLETGLKHQIRIQAAEHDMALLGDRSYHDGTQKAVKRKGAKLPYQFQRQALHAAVIGIKHPDDGRKVRFESRIPGDMQDLEVRLSD
ncbi:MAG: RluA family pseudouridine synthase [Opitutaceae bacterium]